MPVSKAAAAAGEIRRAAKKNGLTVTAKLTHDWNRATREFDGRVIDAAVTAEVYFTPGDVGAYIAAERACNALLSRFRMIRPGSVWGTDSGSVGGHAGLTGGHCRMSKSGVEIRLARQFAAEKRQAAK
jgi:hypothetical protein